MEEIKSVINDDEMYKWISYKNLIEMFDNFNTGMVMIGGLWCKDTYGVMEQAARLARKRDITIIYSFDPVFTNDMGLKEDLRDCLSLERRMEYYALVEKSGFTSDVKAKETLISRIPLPTFMAVRNGVCTGYYSCKLGADGLSQDQALDFAEHFLALCEEVKKNDRYMK